MSERELKRIMTRQQEILDSAQAAGDNLDRSNVEMQLSEIVRDYETLLRRDPEFVSTYIAYGLFLNTTGHPRRSFDIFKRAEKIAPEVPVIKNQIGNHHAEEGEYAEALKYYREAARLSPKEALYHYQLGSLLYEYRDFFVDDKVLGREELLKESAAEFARAAELAPANIGYGYRYAESFYDLPTPDWEGALAAWKTLEQRMKAGLEIQTVQLHEANILIQLARLDDARALLDGITEEPLLANKEQLVAKLPDTDTTDKAP